MSSGPIFISDLESWLSWLESLRFPPNYYLQDNVTAKQESLRTKDRAAAERLLHARNEAARQPAINRGIALAYLRAADPKLITRTWQQVMDAVLEQKHGETLRRWQTAVKDPAFDCIRQRPVIETTAEELIRLVDKGTVSTNVYMRRLHNFALDMDWLLKSVVPKRQWPKVVHRPGKAIQADEQQRIVEREQNSERKAFYQFCWHLGGSRTDVACLLAEDVDWKHRTVTYSRRKLAGRNVDPATIRFGDEVASILRSLSQHGPLFPYLRTVRSADRATEFKQRCIGLGIKEPQEGRAGLAHELAPGDHSQSVGRSLMARCFVERKALNPSVAFGAGLNNLGSDAQSFDRLDY